MLVSGFFVILGVIVFVRSSQYSIRAMADMIPYFCPMKTYFKLSCPGCGMTHSVIALLKGEFRLALTYNPLVFLLLGIFLMAMTRLHKLIPEKIQRYALIVMICFIITWRAWTRFLPAMGILPLIF